MDISDFNCQPHSFRCQEESKGIPLYTTVNIIDEERDRFLHCFQQLRSYQDQIETQNWEKSSLFTNRSPLTWH